MATDSRLPLTTLMHRLLLLVLLQLPLYLSFSLIVTRVGRVRITLLGFRHRLNSSAKMVGTFRDAFRVPASAQQAMCRRAFVAHSLLNKNRHTQEIKTMKATIVSHEKPPESGAAEIHRFKFKLDDGNAPPLTESISLRTARVIVDNLADGNAFIKMLHAIVRTPPDDYDSLVGKGFPDHYSNSPSGEHRMPGPDSEGPCP